MHRMTQICKKAYHVVVLNKENLDHLASSYPLNPLNGMLIPSTLLL